MKHPPRVYVRGGWGGGIGLYVDIKVVTDKRFGEWLDGSIDQ